MSVSVALAAKDGAQFILAQVESVLLQLDEARGDELVISVDPSLDDTADIARRFSEKSPLVKYIDGPGRGVQANFEHALNACQGDYIFLCDQDDVWMPNKVEEVMKALEVDSAELVLHDAMVVDEGLKQLHASFFEQRGSKQGVWQNILKNSFMGCCMAFKKELLQTALPFPVKIPMHDQWLGLMATQQGTVSFLPQQLIKYRRHTNTATANEHAGVWQMIAWRYDIIRALQERKRKLK